MSFQNQTNLKRVEKIVDTVELLSVSASSNKASSEEIWEMLTPAMEAISELVGAETRSPDPEPSKQAPTGLQTPRWADVREMAQKASLKDLTVAMAVYLNRIDEELN